MKVIYVEGKLILKGRISRYEKERFYNKVERVHMRIKRRYRPTKRAYHIDECMQGLCYINIFDALLHARWSRRSQLRKAILRQCRLYLLRASLQPFRRRDPFAVLELVGEDQVVVGAKCPEGGIRSSGGRDGTEFLA
jgi:hypothetical protein